ncbi:guanine nucleotide exchange factor VAV2 isoform X2 [Dermacentor albipictus]|uniref:guanine nucleotide exchange factor VAV2 isoform X2 n=1 Tax=Dermacentor albipictus TaxID=60249 RepID=UPI0031FD0A6D
MADALWRDCANWLIRCQALPSDHRVTWVNAQLIDLANTLRDGVLLCQLLNKLQPGCVDLKEMSLRPQMSQFLCLKNIRTFLQTCKNVFNLSNSDLFEPNMLFEYGDFRKVLHTLAVLSRSPKAEESGVRGFSDKSSTSHDYYNDEAFNLEDAVNNEAFGKFGEYEYEAVTNDDEDIYEDLCAFRRVQVPAAAPTAPLEKRDYCIKELIETEKNYIEALNMITRDFMRPLKDVLTPEENEIIFKHIKELAETHTGFHADLHKACLSSQHLKISECFLRWKDKFIVYGDYCSNLPKAQEQIDELCSKKQLVNQCVLNCQQKANDGKFKLRDLLSVPMQRVLKYHLLLKELMKNTAESHEDYNGLEKALQTMLDLAHYINEVKRDNETLQIIADIQASITDVDLPQNMELKDYGRLLKDGELKIKSHDDNNKIKNRYIFIFDRMMLMCKSTKIMDKLFGGEQYIYKSSLALCDYRLENAPANARMATRYYWYLVHVENRTAYTMYAKTEEMKKKWIEAIEKAMDNIKPSVAKYTDHHFMMHTFKVPTYCADCNKLLPGIFFQGYKCTVCGLGVHKVCIGTVRSCGAPSLPPRPSSHLGSQSSTDEPTTPPRPHHDHGANGIRFSISIAKAKQSFTSSSLGYLSFAADDVIEVLRKISSSIWEGRLQRTTEEGLFPAACVEELDKRGSYECPAPLGRSYSSGQQGMQSCAPPLPPSRDGYVNLNLEEYPWFAGTMEREGATALLEKSPSGTFLLRISAKQNGGYAISINFDNQVKHMRVCYDDNQFYLSETKMFRSIVELVSWYETHSLSESFKGLEISLLIPFKNVVSAPITNGTVEHLGHAVALHNFQPTTESMLGLVKGDVVTVLSKAGQEKGWWKGQIQERVGYFPWQYVQELPATSTEC